MSKQSRRPDKGSSRTQRAAAVRAEQARRESTKKIGIVALIVVVLGAIIAAGVWFGSGSSGDDSTPAASVPVRASTNSLIIGKASAPVKVVIYEDFQCPFCNEFESASRDYLHAYAAKGTVQVDYRPFNLLTDLPYSALALNAFAAVLHHGTPQQALKLHDLFYENQPYEQDSSSVSEADIAGWVKQVGADTTPVRQAMQSIDQAYFKATTQAAVQAGVKGTPTVLVNGKPLGGGKLSVGDMSDQLEQLLAKQK